MVILGLHVTIWVVLVVYFAAMLWLGWCSKRHAQDPEGYLLGGRKFGVPMMVMHAFGAGTNPTDTTGTISKTVAAGASGIWVSWMWMFGTPFYWLIAPLCRRMRYLTLADYFRERFGRGAAVLYTLVASVGMTVFFGGVLLATVRTVQGMMGQSIGTAAGFDWWFYGILSVTTVVFVLYGYWGGIVAAVRTDMVQGLMIIVLSFLAIPLALQMKEVAGLSGMRKTLANAEQRVTGGRAAALRAHAAGNPALAVSILEDTARYDAGGPVRTALVLAKDGKHDEAMAALEGSPPLQYRSLFDPGHFSLLVVILLCIQAPLSALALPHLMSVTAAGKTEWEGRVGFTGGNLLKRICTIGWSILGLAWLAYLIRSGADIHPDAAFGDAIQQLLPPFLQGLMLACVMAASMSSGDAVQVTVAGLFTQSIYREYIRPEADERQQLRFTKTAGIVIIAVSVVFAIVMQNDLVGAILGYFRILAVMGISTAMGLLWRRMNQVGVFTSVVAATAVFLAVKFTPGLPRAVGIGAPIVAGILFGIIGSLLSARPDPARIERFFTRIYTPVGEEEKLELSLAEAVPESQRWLTAGGLFIVKPSRQSWVGFVVTLAICLACVGVMLMIL
ncbi:sodium:solute symporter family protein [bacterium]|nr:sodium:solute symporter family protein [bacterium]